jgi:uncharacterized membrane protein
MKIRWTTAALLAALWTAAAVAYPRLPDRIPTHWNLRGQPDGWGGPAAAFLFPAIATGVAVLLHLLPRIDPRRAHWEKFGHEMGLIVNLVIGLAGWIEGVSLGAALGWKIDMTRALLVGVGLFLAAIGNWLPRIRSNWWMGIRTPWTLESERVWRETHRVGGRVFVAAGLLVAAGAFLPQPLVPVVSIAAIGAVALVPVVYSYVAWRRESRRAG